MYIREVGKGLKTQLSGGPYVLTSKFASCLHSTCIQLAQHPLAFPRWKVVVTGQYLVLSDVIATLGFEARHSSLGKTLATSPSGSRLRLRTFKPSPETDAQA